jgi:Flp pilus assembly pilin Flp
MNLLKKFVREEEGISSVEYALLLAFVGEMNEAATEIGTSVN